MKLHSIFSLLFLILFTSCSTSQTKPDVPELILTRFKALYPNAEKVKWENENTTYEASFKQDKKELTVVFVPDGMVDRTEMEIDPSALPPAISEYVSANLEGKKIEDAVKIVDGFGAVTFEIEVGQSDYLFLGSGEFIGIQPPEPGDDEDDDK